MKVLTGNSNRALAEAICAYLNLPLTRASIADIDLRTLSPSSPSMYRRNDTCWAR